MRPLKSYFSLWWQGSFKSSRKVTKVLQENKNHPANGSKKRMWDLPPAKGRTKQAVKRWELTCVMCKEDRADNKNWHAGRGLCQIAGSSRAGIPCWGQLSWERWMCRATSRGQDYATPPQLPHNLGRERKLPFLPATQKLKGNLIISLLQDSQSFNYWKSGDTYSNLISLEKSCCFYWQNLCHWWEISHSDFKSSCSLAAWFIKLMGHFLLSPLRIRSMHW